MGCHTSRDVASGFEMGKEEDQNTPHERRTSKGSSSFSSNFSSLGTESELPGCLRSDMDDVSSTASLSSSSHRYHRHNSGKGITQSSIAFEGAIAFNEDISIQELGELEPLAAGGFCLICSCVYRGHNAALKIPRPDSPEGAVEDLIAEIHVYKLISAQGGHRNITRAFGSGLHVQQDQEMPFLLLERLDGGTLHQLLDNPDLPQTVWEDPSYRLEMGLGLAEALHFLHNKTVPGGFVLHRDLKPSNIGLCEKGSLKVFDLGLSVIQEVKEGRDDKYEMSGMAGSKRFMAPEVCRGLAYNEKVDVYSFSIVLWEMFTRQKPFSGMSVEEHYREVMIGGLRPPVDPSWPIGLQDLFECCWDADPDRRPSIEEARDTLRAILGRDGDGVAEQ